MKRKTKIIIYSTCILLILLIMLGFTYGYFITKIDGNKNAKSIEIVSGESKVLYTDLTSEDISEIIEPGYTHIKLFTVQNIGNIRAKYSIYLTDVINTFNRKEDIKYTLYRKVGNNTIDTSDFTDCDVIVSNITYPSSKSLVKGNEEIVTPQSYYTYALKITYINSTENQNIDQGKKFSGKIQLYPTDSEDLSNPYSEGTLSHAIINSARNPKDSNSTTWGNTVTEFTSVSGANDRLLNNAPDDYGTSYYYYGAVTDNYVSFADKLWRIVRINGDGTIRLVLDDVAKNSSGTEITTAFNSSSNDNAYVGYMYGTAGSATYDAIHENINDSTIKQIIDKWYEDNLKTSYANYLSDTLFCNDKTLASNGIGGVTTQLGYGSNKTFYALTERLIYSTGTTEITTAKPTFKCAESATNDYSRFTVDVATLSNGKQTNGNLKYPIGLLTADEISYAGAYKISQTNKTYYLYNSSITSPWWLSSPFAYNGVDAYEWYVGGSSGYISHISVDYSSAFRPSINLKAELLVGGGDGTSSNPYTVKLQ